MKTKLINIDFNSKIDKLVKEIEKLKPYTQCKVDVSRYSQTDISQKWFISLETPENVLDYMEAIIEKDPYMHILFSGMTPGKYDWSYDVYNRDYCWVKFLISASKP